MIDSLISRSEVYLVYYKNYAPLLAETPLTSPARLVHEDRSEEYFLFTGNETETFDCLYVRQRVP